MKTLLTLLAILTFSSCSPEIIPGKQHVQNQHRKANYDMDRKLGKKYRPTNFHPVTLQKRSSKKVPSPIRY